MPNITISLDEKLYRRARIYAASRNTTVTQLLRDFLQQTVPSGFSAEQAELETLLRRYSKFFRMITPLPPVHSRCELRTVCGRQLPFPVPHPSKPIQ